MWLVIDKLQELLGGHLKEINITQKGDPEGDYEGLFVYAHTDLSPYEMMKFMDLFDENYWFDIDDAIAQMITIILRPEPNKIPTKSAG